MNKEILQTLIEGVQADTAEDKEHSFAEVVAIAGDALDDIGEDGVRELISAGAQHLGFTEGVKFRKQLGFNKSAADIQPILDEFNISYKP